jgi:dCMP deaminase
VRPGWDEYYLGIAEAVSRRGECSRRQVGAVIVREHSIVGTGYNGAPAGQASCLDGACPRAALDVVPGTGYAATGCHVIHAEANALIRAGRERTLGATLYVTCAPCDLCSPLIEAAGITRVVHA